MARNPGCHVYQGQKRDKREFCNSDLLGQDPAMRQELTAQQEFLNTLVSLKV